MSAEPVIAVDHLDVRFGRAACRPATSRSMSAKARATGSLAIRLGKSTVLRVLAGSEPSSGPARSTFTAQPQPKRRDKAFHGAVQMVFQDPYGSLHPKKTIDDALAEPLSIHGIGGADARITRALDEVGLPQSFRFRYPQPTLWRPAPTCRYRPSAKSWSPAILLLDEPTSALDVSIQAEVLNLLQALRGERRLTYILVSHNLAVVAHMCERLLVMQLGQAVEEMDADRLTARAPRTEYARQLLVASEGFRRASA